MRPDKKLWQFTKLYVHDRKYITRQSFVIIFIKIYCTLKYFTCWGGKNWLPLKVHIIYILKSFCLSVKKLHSKNAFVHVWKMKTIWYHKQPKKIASYILCWNNKQQSFIKQHQQTLPWAIQIIKTCSTFCHFYDEKKYINKYNKFKAFHTLIRFTLYFPVFLLFLYYIIKHRVTPFLLNCHIQKIPSPIPPPALFLFILFCPCRRCC